MPRESKPELDAERWQTASLRQMLAALQGGRLSDRKWRLFACACVRRLPSARRGTSEKALELAERFADGKASSHELAAARFGGRFVPGHAGWAVCWPPGEDPVAMAERALSWVTGFIVGSAHFVAYRREEDAQAELLREVVGNPFRPARVDPLWLAWEGGTVARLARAVYDERAFAQMPVLGDALEEAGCQDPILLDHCRRPAAEHVRGCWLLDLLLGLS